MKFKLLYIGEVKINPKKRSQHLQDIRDVLSPQLKRLSEISPYNEIKKKLEDIQKQMNEEEAARAQAIIDEKDAREDAIKKAIQDANKKLITIPLIDGRTVAHEAIGHAGAARVIIKPAAAGTGVIAGGSVRAILELAGIRDVVSKSLGARTKLNMARAAMNALKSIKTAEQVAALRGKTVEEILG